MMTRRSQRAAITVAAALSALLFLGAPAAAQEGCVLPSRAGAFDDVTIRALRAGHAAYVNGADADALSQYEAWLAHTLVIGVQRDEEAVEAFLRLGELRSAAGFEEEAYCAYVGAYRAAIGLTLPTPAAVTAGAEGLVRATRIHLLADAETSAQALFARLQRIPGYSPRTLFDQKADAWGALALVRADANNLAGAAEALRAYDEVNAPGHEDTAIMIAARAAYAERSGDSSRAENLLRSGLANARGGAAATAEARTRRQGLLVDTLAGLFSRTGRCTNLEALASGQAPELQSAPYQGHAIRWRTQALQCFTAARDRPAVRRVSDTLVREIRSDIARRVERGQMFHLSMSNRPYRLAGAQILAADRSLGLLSDPQSAELRFQAAQMFDFSATTWSLAFLRRIDEEGNERERARLRTILRAESVFARFTAAGAIAPEQMRRNSLSQSEFDEIVQDWTAQNGLAPGPSVGIDASALMPSLGDMQRRLGPADAILIVGLESPGVWVTLVRSGQITTRQSPVSAAQLLRDLSILRQSLYVEGAAAETRFDFAAAYRIYEAIFAPVSRELAGAERIMWCPDVAIAGLPPAALVEAPVAGEGPEAMRSAPWLARRFSFVTLTAPLAVMFPARQARRTNATYLGVGDPAIGRRPEGASGAQQHWRGVSYVADLEALPSLPETADEIRHVAAGFGARARLLLGPEASEEALRRLNLSDYRIIHFATHGLSGGDIVDLEEPALVLTSPHVFTAAANDGLLTASEIALLHLDADWVILSACNTAAPGLQPLLPGAEPLSGYARAFLLAGAKNVVVSHWPVESDAAAALTTQMLDRWQEGESRAQALKSAMEAMMSDEQHPEWSHPRYWAMFALVVTGTE